MLLCGRGGSEKGCEGLIQGERGSEGEGSGSAGVEEIQLFLQSQLLLLSAGSVSPSLSFSHTPYLEEAHSVTLFCLVRKMKESIFHSCYQMGIVSAHHISKRRSHGQIRQNLSLCFHHILLTFLLCLSCNFFCLSFSFSAMT